MKIVEKQLFQSHRVLIRNCCSVVCFWMDKGLDKLYIFQGVDLGKGNKSFIS